MFNTLLKASIDNIELEKFFNRSGYCYVVYRVFAKKNGRVIPYRIKEKYSGDSLSLDSKLLEAWVYQDLNIQGTASRYIPIPNNAVYGYIMHDIKLQEIGNGTNGNQ